MKIALIIILCLIIFILVHVLISQLDDLCEYEKKIKKALETICKDWYDKNTIPIEQVGISNDLRVELFKILIEGEDKE